MLDVLVMSGVSAAVGRLACQIAMFKPPCRVLSPFSNAFGGHDH